MQSHYARIFRCMCSRNKLYLSLFWTAIHSFFTLAIQRHIV